MEVKEMKSKKTSYSMARTVLIAMMCLIVGIQGSMSVFAAESDMPVLGWDILVGGSSSDEMSGSTETADGNFVSVGAEYGDGMLVKTSPQGTIIWKKMIGGSGYDKLYSVIELSDGSLIVAGHSNSSASGSITDTNNGSGDGLLVKFNSNGDQIWDKLVGGSDNDKFLSIVATKDGGFITVGGSRSSADGEISDSNNGSENADDGYIVKFDAAGNIQWDNLFGSPEADIFFDVIQTSDGGFIAVGSAVDVSDDNVDTNSGGEITDSPAMPGPKPHDGLLVKFDGSGHMVWNNLFGSTGEDDFYGITATPDGGFVVVGGASAIDGDITTGEVTGGYAALVAKFDSSGIAQWNRAFSVGAETTLMDVAKTRDGCFITTGFAALGDSDGGYSGVLTKIGSSGNVVGTYNYNGTGADYFNSVVVDPRGHILAVGKTTSSQSGDIKSTSNGLQDGLVAYYGFTPERFDVHFEANGGSTVPDQEIAYGDKVAKPAEPVRNGYSFVGWYTDVAFSNAFSFSAPIHQDTTLYAKWYKNIMLNSIASDHHNISGIGEPGLSVIVSLANGTKLETKVKADGTWLIDLPKNYTLKAGTKVMADMYYKGIDGVEVSSTEKVIIAAAVPPKTGDVQDLFPVWVFGMFLGMIIMRRAFKGPKVRRRF
jgi:uncharacterized repeat protein (TIGR02543 family)